MNIFKYHDMIQITVPYIDNTRIQKTAANIYAATHQLTLQSAIYIHRKKKLGGGCELFCHQSVSLTFIQQFFILYNMIVNT